MYVIMSNQHVYSANEHVEAMLLDSAILVEENVVWDGPTDEDEETVDFPDDTDATLPENINESFVTADGNNTTQYFSLDASNETVLNDISDASVDTTRISDVNSTLEAGQDSNGSINGSEQQVVLFRIDDSDDLYGIQIGQDEEGNLQKYQFKVRQNEEGNLEAVPESIQILPLDNESDAIGSSDIPQENEEILPGDNEENIGTASDSVTMFVKQEHVNDQLLQNNDVSSREQFEDDEEEGSFQDHSDTKEGILEEAAHTIIHKQEIFDGEDVSETEDFAENVNEQYFDQTTEDDINEVGENLNGPVNYYVNEDAHADVEICAEAPGHYEQLFVKESHLIEEDSVHHEELAEEIRIGPAFAGDEDEEEGGGGGEQSPESHSSELGQENMNGNESSNEDYEIVEGDHVTGEADSHTDELHTSDDLRTSLSLQEQYIKHNARPRKLIKNVIRKIRIKKMNNVDKDTNMYYFVKNTEKENVGEITANTVLRPNPRSILKCSVTSVESKKDLEEEKYEKRFAKSKEAQQARRFHNFIAQTKIIHAPVRQERLPRKQTIKPMERTDEEIVVQEVVVCSNGFIETSEDGVLKERTSIKPTEYIQLSDSDEDYDPKAKNKRKRKHRKRKPQIEITISDSEDEWSDASVIEIDGSDDDDEDDDEQSVVATPPKRPRGRPRKNSMSADLNTSVDSEKIVGAKNDHNDNGNNVVKRPRGRPPKISKNLEPKQLDEIMLSVRSQSGNGVRNEGDDKLIIIKTDNKCPKCPKSFPSEGSLRTHMQYHNFKESNKKIKPTTSKEEPKYKCNICSEVFKNNFLLTRHAASHKSSKMISCAICKKIFNDMSQLATHKRTHVKQQMFKTTSVAKVTPRKVLQPNLVGPVKKAQANLKCPKKSELKCKDCGKLVSSSSILAVHMKTHKRFQCGTCSASFLSQLMLQTHMRRSCVKTRPLSKRLSFSARKSLRKPPTRISSRAVPRQSVVAQAVSSSVPEASKSNAVHNVIVTNIKCDSCPMTFATYTSLFKHKVVKHGLETPERPIKNTPVKNSAYKQHCGVPPSEKLRSAFKELKGKLEK